MKKLIITLLIVLAAIPAMFAQNANRSGFFMEVAYGGVTGDTPVMGYSVKNGTVYADCVHGSAVNLALGYRRATSRHWAYEFRIEGQTSTDKPDLGFVGKVLPVGFRYTSPEVFRNISLYGHFNIGGAIGAVNQSMAKSFGEYYYSSNTTPIQQNTDTKYSSMFEDNDSFGAAYQIGIGVNLSNHLYVEALWDSQVMFATYGKDGESTLHWGMVGARLGFRF